MNIRIQEMEDDYILSIRKSILDYVLMDKSEQGRLGLTMAKKVFIA